MSRLIDFYVETVKLADTLGISTAIRFSNGNRRVLATTYRYSSVEFNPYYIMYGEVEDIANTVLHEFAHVMTPGAGHGVEWRNACRAIGAIPRAKANLEPHWLKFTMNCIKCESILDFRSTRKMNLTRYSHSNCGGKLEWRENSTHAAKKEMTQNAIAQFNRWYVSPGRVMHVTR